MPPAVLIHGFWDSAKDMRSIARYLEGAGRSVHCLDLIPNNARIPLGEMARGVATLIEERLGNAQKFDLVGYSMGGIVARHYVQRLDQAHRIRKLVTISSPHGGTWTARPLPRAGLRGMRRGSEFLRDLQRDEDLLRRVHFTSIWTPFDMMIVPPSSSRVSVGRSIRVNVLAHRLMLTDRRVLKLVEEVLAEPV